MEEEGLPLMGAVFTYYFAESILDDTLDSNLDGFVSVQEAFDTASQRTRTYYRDAIFEVPDYLVMFEERITSLDLEDYRHVEWFGEHDSELILDLNYYEEH